MDVNLEELSMMEIATTTTSTFLYNTFVHSGK
jgi:hypothetical protein